MIDVNCRKSTVFNKNHLFNYEKTRISIKKEALILKLINLFTLSLQPNPGNQTVVDFQKMVKLM